MFILASQSPQRKAILQNLHVPFDTIPSGFDESSIIEQDPIKRALLLAEAKAAVIASRYPDQWIIGVDTLVVAASGELLEKPVDANDARRMLDLHSGRTSIIHSALSLQKGGKKFTAVSTASVTFKHLTDRDIASWIETKLWHDRSGAFQIEGEGEKLIVKIEGEYETVVGFPVKLFQEMIDREHIVG
ncbi:MAG TPA: nucleoside triphosphate pyrophosphatase [Candidatus Peribacterales bacterium]|nr:nucleoside triphosphate pyrophosphatase [Candidatus Peribacterales bacterium]